MTDPNRDLGPGGPNGRAHDGDQARGDVGVGSGADANANADADLDGPIDLNSGDAPGPSAVLPGRSTASGLSGPGGPAGPGSSADVNGPAAPDTPGTPGTPDRHTYHAPGRRVVIWRHGQTTWNVEGRFQGQTDVPLDAVGHDQARRAARLLSGLRPYAIVSSDLGRAVDTARQLALLTGLEVELDAGLRETYAGSWQGLTDAEIREKFPEEFAAWRKNHGVRRGGGELETEVADRVVPAIERALTGVPDRATLVVVSHGGSSRVAIGRLLGLPAEHWSSLGGLSNCCWSVLGEAKRGWRLLEHNAGSLPEPVIGDDEDDESASEATEAAEAGSGGRNGDTESAQSRQTA